MGKKWSTFILSVAVSDSSLSVICFLTYLFCNFNVALCDCSKVAFIFNREIYTYNLDQNRDISARNI